MQDLAGGEVTLALLAGQDVARIHSREAAKPDYRPVLILDLGPDSPEGAEPVNTAPEAVIGEPVVTGMDVAFVGSELVRPRRNCGHVRVDLR